MAPANTGNDNNNKNAVINTDHTNSDTRCATKPGNRMFNIVTIKLMAPRIDDMPAICKLNIAMSTEAPECASIDESGG